MNKVIVLAGALGVLLMACPSAKCDATTCATGCCDSAGKCQNGDTAASCGNGGGMCMSCVGGTCSALKVCMLATGGGTGGGATGGGTGGGATGGGATGGGTGGGSNDGGVRAVTWVRHVPRLQENGTTVMDDSMPTGQLGIFVRNGNAMMEVPGARNGNSYVAQNVPPGAYFVHAGTSWIEGTTDTIDTGFNDLGRLDTQQIDAGAATLGLSVTGLPAWGGFLDDLEFFSVGANLYGLGSVGGISGPMEGEVPTSFAFDYGKLAFFDSAPRLEAAKGDTLYVSHLQNLALITTPVPGAADDGGVLDVPLNCQIARGSARLNTVTITAGANSASVPFAPSPANTIGVTWPRTQWDARRAEVHPNAVTTLESLYYAAEPAPDTASGDLINCLNDARFDNPISDVNQSVMVGNPYPSSWAVTGVLSVSYRVSMAVADAGTWSSTGTESVKVDLGVPLAPGVHAPTAVTIQSIPANQIVTAAVANPLSIVWAPPNGTPAPTDYSVQVLRLTKDSFGTLSRTTVTSAVVRSATSFSFPAGTLASGAMYQVRVRARVNAGTADRPFVGRVSSTADAISNPFLAQ